MEKEKVEKLKAEVNIIGLASNLLHLTFDNRRQNETFLKTKEFSSLVFDTRMNIAFYNKEGKTLDIFGLVMFVLNVSFPEALKIVQEYHYGHPDEKVVIRENKKPSSPEDKEGFVFPPKNNSTSRVEKYLIETRCLSPVLVKSLINASLLYEDNFGNCVFLSRDVRKPGRQGKIVFGNRRGTGKERFQRDCKNSFKLNGFFLTGGKDCEKLVITESVIDALSYWTLCYMKKGRCDAHLLASSGAASMSAVLDYNLALNPELHNIKKIEVYSDNDDAGVHGWADIVDYFFPTGSEKKQYSLPISDRKKYSVGILRIHFWENKEGKEISKNIKDVNDVLKYEKNRISSASSIMTAI